MQIIALTPRRTCHCLQSLGTYTLPTAPPPHHVALTRPLRTSVHIHTPAPPCISMRSRCVHTPAHSHHGVPTPGAYTYPLRAPHPYTLPPSSWRKSNEKFSPIKFLPTNFRNLHNYAKNMKNSRKIC